MKISLKTYLLLQKLGVDHENLVRDWSKCALGRNREFFSITTFNFEKNRFEYFFSIFFMNFDQNMPADHEKPKNYIQINFSQT